MILEILICNASCLINKYIYICLDYYLQYFTSNNKLLFEETSNSKHNNNNKFPIKWNASFFTFYFVIAILLNVYSKYSLLFHYSLNNFRTHDWNFDRCMIEEFMKILTDLRHVISL